MTYREMYAALPEDQRPTPADVVHEDDCPQDYGLVKDGYVMPCARCSCKECWDREVE